MAAMTSAQPHTAARHDFDFLFGRWIIHNRKLAGRPQPGGTDWVDFSAQGEARPLLGGRRFTNGHGVFLR